MSHADFKTLLATLRTKGIEIQAGLADAEINAVEGRYRFTFPPDLRQLLQIGLPVSTKAFDGDFPDWRFGDEKTLRERLNWPTHGILFDVEHNDFWWEAWGPRPTVLEDAVKIARSRLREAHKLVPVYSHRYIPCEPLRAGNPIFSVYQTDVIIYGVDLASYFEHEFNAGNGLTINDVGRPIRFWTELVRWNSARHE
jgi:hypothetical protein